MLSPSRGTSVTLTSMTRSTTVLMTTALCASTVPIMESIPGTGTSVYMLCVCSLADVATIELLLER